MSEMVIFDQADQPIEVRLEAETVWLTQAQMAELFGKTRQNISLHIRNIFKEGELEEDSVVKESLTTAADGKRYKTRYYNLDVIISVGYRVKSPQGVRFRQMGHPRAARTPDPGLQPQRTPAGPTRAGGADPGRRAAGQDPDPAGVGTAICKNDVLAVRRIPYGDTEYMQKPRGNIQMRVIEEYSLKFPCLDRY